MKEVVVSQRADKALQSMQLKRRLAIIAKVKAYARCERVDINKMKDMELWRIRVGDDRVIIDDQGRIVLIVAAGPRGSIYKEKEAMGRIQRIEIEGKAYVLLSEEDYEDLVDGLEASAVLAEIAGGQEVWPLDIVEARVNGENPVRVFRTYRKMTVSDLAAAAGISQPYLSEIESGKKTGSVDVLKRIAAALKVDLDDIVV